MDKKILVAKMNCFADSEDSESARKNLVKLCDAYGILGNLKCKSSQGILNYIALVTGCISVGKLASSEVPLNQVQFDDWHCIMAILDL